MKEKPAWIERLKQEGRFEDLVTERPPAPWYRVLYYGFGLTALTFGIYILVNGIIYGRYVELH
ncbi:MAG: hypothetical protein JRJ29_18765 [Deltaproteobacteria bacterium]|nr:hypothetical protein [Deltaproteobacteria bacterium]